MKAPHPPPRIVTGILRAGRMLVNDWVKEVAHVGPRRAVGEQIVNLSSCVPLFLCPPVLGKIRSAVGSAQLLMSQKFQQFYWLCQQNLVSCASAVPLGHCALHVCALYMYFLNNKKVIDIVSCLRCQPGKWRAPHELVSCFKWDKLVCFAGLLS